MKPYTPSWSEWLGGLAQHAVEGLRGHPDFAGDQNVYDITQKVAGLIPGLGNALSANQAYRDAKSGNYLGRVDEFSPVDAFGIPAVNQA